MGPAAQAREVCRSPVARRRHGAPETKTRKREMRKIEFASPMRAPRSAPSLPTAQAYPRGPPGATGTACMHPATAHLNDAPDLNFAFWSCRRRCAPPGRPSRRHGPRLPYGARLTRLARPASRRRHGAPDQNAKCVISVPRAAAGARRPARPGRRHGPRRPQGTRLTPRARPVARHRQWRARPEHQQGKTSNQNIKYAPSLLW